MLQAGVKSKPAAPFLSRWISDFVMRRWYELSTRRSAHYYTSREGSGPETRKVTRLLTVRCGRYHEESVRSDTVMKGSISCRGTFRATTGLRRQQATLVRAARLPDALRCDGTATACPHRSGAPFGGGQTDGWVGGRRKTAHNVTTAADYRTALLSDSP
jgi:hypothetical protein